MKKTIVRLICVVGLCALMPITAAAASFSDIPSGVWYEQAVVDVAEKGFMTGTADGAFSPDAQVTRAAVVTVLWRLEGVPYVSEESFSDAVPGAWYETALIWARQQGIANGYNDGTFGPDMSVTREQLAVFLYRYAQYREEQTANGVLTIYQDAGKVSTWAADGMKHAVGAGLITGTDGNRLEPTGRASRAQLAVILQRLMIPASG